MGCCGSKRKDAPRVLLLGLDAAGKTTVLQNLQHVEGGEVSEVEIAETTPTLGFNVERLGSGARTFEVWDVAGQSKIRPLWKHYFLNVSGLVWVVDATDTDRFWESKRELSTVLAAPELEGVPVLVFANKQDMDGALDVDHVLDEFDLVDVMGEDRTWTIMPSVAIDPDPEVSGVGRGVEWLFGDHEPR